QGVSDQGCNSGRARRRVRLRRVFLSLPFLSLPFPSSLRVKIRIGAVTDAWQRVPIWMVRWRQLRRSLARIEMLVPGEGRDDGEPVAVEHDQAACQQFARDRVD